MTCKLAPILSFLFAFSALQSVSADDLGKAMSESGWDRIIGKWVDEDTGGKFNTTTYSWRFKNQVVEAVSDQGDKREVALIGRNPNTEEIFHFSTDDQGGSSIGKWEGQEDGSATLCLLFVTGKGEEGSLSINYRFENDDTMTVTVALPEPLIFRMVRVK